MRTDHKPCLAMKVSKVASERMYRWALEMQGFNMEIFHVSGAKHEDADAISRLGYLKDMYEKMHFGEEALSIHTICIEDNVKFRDGGETLQLSETNSGNKSFTALHSSKLQASDS